MAAKFEINKAKNGSFFFNLKAANGLVILSSEQYKQKNGVTAGIKSVRSNAGKAARYNKKKSSNGKHYFTLSASNGEVIGKSQMYSSTSGMDNGIKSVSNNANDARVVDNS